MPPNDVRSTASLLTSELIRVATKIPTQQPLQVAGTKLGQLVPQRAGRVAVNVLVYASWGTDAAQMLHKNAVV